MSQGRYTHSCEECGSAFTSDKPDQVYCSRSCVAKAIRTARQDSAYRRWKQAVIERDEYTCQMCGDQYEDKGPLVAHHIVPLSECKEARTEVSNGMTLCKTPCHDIIHGTVGNTSYRQVYGRFQAPGVST